MRFVYMKYTMNLYTVKIQQFSIQSLLIQKWQSIRAGNLSIKIWLNI